MKQSVPLHGNRVNCPSIPVMRAQKHLIVICPINVANDSEALEEIEDAINRIFDFLRYMPIVNKPINKVTTCVPFTRFSLKVRIY